MSAAAAATAPRPDAERGRPSAAGLAELLAAALDASLPLAGNAGRRERHAALAVAEAASRASGFRSSSADRVPAAAIAAAAEALGPLDGFERAELATELAATFERAVGSSGRRNQGVVYTPVDVVRFMVREGLAARFAYAIGVEPDAARAVAAGDVGSLDRTELARLARLLSRLRAVDPAVGAGAFLAVAAEQISRLARALRERGAPLSSRLTTPRAALEHCCHGFEVDPDATHLAGIVLALRCDGGGADTVPSVVTTRNALTGGLSHPRAKRGWDLVLMNPPYVGGKHLRSRLGEEFQRELRDRDGFAGDLLSHFVVCGLRGLRRGGVLSAIVSDTAFTMGSASPVRGALLEQAALFSLAWCRPFTVAAHGGIVTATRGGRSERGANIRCFEADRSGGLDRVRGRNVRLDGYLEIPGRPLFRPSGPARALAARYRRVDDLEHLWRAVVGRRSGGPEGGAPEAGDWTLLGCAVQAGQGLATGDDRRFVGFLDGTEAARAAIQRQHRIVDELRADPQRRGEWRRLKRSLASGEQLGEALAALLDRDEGVELPGRKPFRVVESGRYRRRPLSEDERRHGIASGPAWIPYETSDRSGAEGGARWTRENPVAIDWSCEAVELLRRRRAEGPKRPVLRHEELWFRGGVTHNRVASYLRARLMPEQAVFSSESPCYVPAAPWLSELSLLALLNSPVVEFALKTFLATRNHCELGHVLRLPVPVLPADLRAELERLAGAALAAARSGQAPTEPERELDALTRELYGVGGSVALPVPR